MPAAVHAPTARKVALSRERAGASFSPAARSPSALPVSSRASRCVCDGHCPRCVRKRITVPVSTPAQEDPEADTELVAEQALDLYSSDPAAPPPDENQNNRRSTRGESRPTAILPPTDALPPLLETALQANRGHGFALETPQRSRMERAFGRDLGMIRLHYDATADRLARALSARAFVAGMDIYFAGGKAPSLNPASTRLLAHEIAHVLQHRGQPHPGRWRLGRIADPAEQEAAVAAARVVQGKTVGALSADSTGVVRRDEPAPPPADPAVIEAWIRQPPAASMQASLNGLEFHPVEEAMIVTPDRDLTPTAFVLARLCDSRYDPTWVRTLQADSHKRIVWDFPGTAEQRTNYFRLRPAAAVNVLAFLDPLIGENIAITAEQRALVVASEALNPVPPPIWLELINLTTPEGSTYQPNVLARNQAVLNQLAALWWTQTQAYVSTFLTWKGTPTTENAVLAAVALQELFAQFDPHAAVLEAIYADDALRTQPAYALLWPPRRDGSVPTIDQLSAQEAARFARYAASQERSLLTLALTDAPARLSLLLGYAAFRGREPSRTGEDQAVSDSPSPYNAPPLPIRMNSYPEVRPPGFTAATGATTTFFTTIRFENFVEAMGHALGGWAYSWDMLRVPGDNIANLGMMSVPPEEHSGWDELNQRLARDVRYSVEDMRRMHTIGQLTALLGPPGINAETLVGASAILDLAGSVISQGIREVNRPSSEFDVPFSTPGLYLVRCRVGPRLSDTPQQAQFRRAPSVAWMPVYAQAPAEMARAQVRQEQAMRSEAEARFVFLRDRLNEPMTHTDDDDSRREMEELRLALYGTTLEVLRSQRTTLDAQRARLEAGTATPEDRAATLTEVRERIERLDQLIALREGRERYLRGTILRPPATLAKDDGTLISLTIEAAELNHRGPRWYVSDITTPNSGHKDKVGDGTLAPEFPAEDSILAALKWILESPSGYGRGQLAIRFPAGLDGPEPGVLGRLRTIRIATDEVGIAMHAVENISTLISIGAVVAAPFTGGASLTLLMPVGLIGALPSAYRLIHRGQMGTLRFDLETAMQVVDVVSAVLQLGEMGAGLRAAARAGTTAGLRWAVVEGSLWIAGVAGNGLGMLMMGAGLMEQIQSLNGLPPGLRIARMTEILGNAMLNIGIQVGAHLASRSHLSTLESSVRTAAAGEDLPSSAVHMPPPEASAPPSARPAGRTAAPPEMVRALPGDVARTPVDVDPHLRGNTVHVEYSIGANGRVDPASVRIVASASATPADIGLHAEAARTLQAYAGLLGAAHEGIQRLREITSGTRSPPQGSAAWEAQIEFAKLDTILRARMADVARLPVDEARAADIAEDLASLRSQLEDTQRILAGYDEANPRGFIAAESVADRRVRIQADNRRLVQENNVGVVVLVDGVVQVREPVVSTAGSANPTPGYVVTGSGAALGLRRLPDAGTLPELMIFTHNERQYIVPRERTSAGLTAESYQNGIRAQLDHYPPPRPGHHWRADPPGWQLQRDARFTGEAERIVTENGVPVRVNGDFVYEGAPGRTFADRRAGAVATQLAPADRNVFLEDALTAAGVNPTDLDRAILRQWGTTLSTLGQVATEQLGRNLHTEAELAHQAVTALAANMEGGTYIEARYKDFYQVLRESAVAAIFGFDRLTLEATLTNGQPLPRPALTPVEQMALYRRLYAALPDPASKGELWTRYRETRGSLPSAAAGGFGDFTHVTAPTRSLQHVPPTVIDGAINVVAGLGAGAPPPGNHALESKGGGSYSPEQAGRYSDHLTANNGRVALADGVTIYEGIVYLFDSPTQARAAVRDLDRASRHAHIYVGYVDPGTGRVNWLPRAGAAATTGGPTGGPTGGGTP